MGKDSSLDTRHKLCLEMRNPFTSQEEHLGGGNPDRVTLALLLQRHGVVVRGGQPEALSLMEALMVSGVLK